MHKFDSFDSVLRDDDGASLLSNVLPIHKVRDSAVICFSHLRWNFVFQRPQHLLSRCARDQRVFFFEEPIRTSGDSLREGGGVVDPIFFSTERRVSGISPIPVL